jgi:hypothetical protein
MRIFASTLVASPSGRYVDWGVLHISVTNLLIIVAMVVLFVLALVVPFPKPRREENPNDEGAS